MMNALQRIPLARPLSLCFAAAMGLGLAACDKSQTNTDTSEPDDTTNLCADYDSCDACISGQQSKGYDEGTAETQCGAAVTGCWTTWDKPVKCGSDTYDEKPS